MQRFWPVVSSVMVVVALVLATPVMVRANSQTVVFGAGFGGYNFSGLDDLRKASPGFGLDMDMDIGLQSQAYLEWYALGSLGFGLRSVNVVSTQSGHILAFYYQQTVRVKSTLITVNWVPIGADSYARLGLLAGVGGAEYELTLSSGSSSNATSTSGTANLLGAYLDWGAEDFGARLGVNALKTKFDNLNNAQVDGSGNGFYLDLRWAWN